MESWCDICKNAQTRGCAAIDAERSRYRIGSVGAGFLGAGLAFAFVIALLWVLVMGRVVKLAKPAPIRKLVKAPGARKDATIASESVSCVKFLGMIGADPLRRGLCGSMRHREHPTGLSH